MGGNYGLPGGGGGLGQWLHGEFGTVEVSSAEERFEGTCCDKESITPDCLGCTAV